MKTNTPGLIQLAQEIDNLPLPELIQEALNLADHFTPKVILLSSLGLKQLISKKIDADILTCESLHDFLRFGLNQHACVIVVGENRAECSFSNLNNLLSSRIQKPFFLVRNDYKTDQEIVEEIENAFSKIKKLSCVENLVDRTASKIAKEKSKIDSSGLLDESSRLNQYKYSQNLLREKTRQIINEKPEVFLADSIKQIRKSTGQ